MGAAVIQSTSPNLWDQLQDKWPLGRESGHCSQFLLSCCEALLFSSYCGASCHRWLNVLVGFWCRRALCSCIYFVGWFLRACTPGIVQYQKNVLFNCLSWSV